MRRGGQRGHGKMSVNRGPLITDHYRGLQDIDKELELLKRKRIIIEQQQQLLASDNMYGNQRYDFNPVPSYNDPHYNPNYDMYEGPGDAINFGGGRKRPANELWHDKWLVPPSKRFPGSKRGQVEKIFGSRLGPAPADQGMRRPPPNPKKQQNQAQKSLKNANRDFDATKVIKPKALLPNLMNDCPASERKTLVANAAPPVTNVGKKKQQEDFVLQADSEPTQKFKGRMELALGKIMKDIKEKFGENIKYEHCFNSTSMVRMMKQIVRDRIREVMLGKSITNAAFVMERYRSHYPPQTDEDVLTAAHMANKDYNIKKYNLIDSDDPAEFFKINMNKLLGLKLNEMFTKLETIYAKEENKNIKQDGLKEGTTPKNENISKEQTEVSNDASDAVENKDVTEAMEEASDVNTDNDAKKDESNVAVADNDATKDENNAAVADKDATKDESNVAVADHDATKDENNVTEANDQPNESNEDSTQDSTEDAPSQEEIDIDDFKGMPLRNKIDWVESLMVKGLPTLLRRFVPYLTKLLNNDNFYTATKAVINAEATRKNLKQPTNIYQIPQEKAATVTDAPLQYYVKLFSRPSLPKKNQMQPFLSKFNPKSIKKHRNVHNLLFIGFANKDDFDNILAADGTQMGKFIFNIKVSEKNPKMKSDEQQQQENEQEDLDKSADKLITPELDDQITDLLTTIRKAEEEELNAEQENDKAEIKSEAAEEPAAESEVSQNDQEMTDTAKEAEQNDSNDTNTNEKPMETIEEEPVKNAKLEQVKETRPATPTRSSARVANATPSSIRTRRASRLMQN